MSPFTWAMLLLVASLALFALELFIPSHGFLGALSTASLAGSLFFMFYGQGLLIGTIYMAILAVLMPMLLVVAVSYWPYTPIGRRILNVPPGQTAETPIAIRHAELLGQRGAAVTKMLPSGSVKISGKTYDAVTAGTAIEPGEPIEVIRVDGTRIVVQRLDAGLVNVGEPAAAEGAADHSSADPLARPITDVIPDPFDDKLT